MNRFGICLMMVASSLFIATAIPHSVSSSDRSSTIADRDRSIAAFRQVATVLQGPRCMNCHVVGDHPRQGDDRHVHLQNVARGTDGKGVPGLRCGNCHQASNNESQGGPPGAPDWQMPSATAPMAWEGLSVGELCQAISDPNRNGHRKVADLIPHMHTSLVLWAWAPGPERTLPPLSYDKFMESLQEWVATGAACEK